MTVRTPAYTAMQALACKAFEERCDVTSLHVQYDPETAGTIWYKDLMKDLLEKDQLALYALH